MAQAEGLLKTARMDYWIFAAALGVRAIYLFLTYDGLESISHVDSAMWLELAQSPATRFGTHDRMPLYPLFLHVHFLAFGAQAPVAAVISQIAVDAAACVGIARLAETIRPGAGFWAGAFAVLNPTQIAMAALLLGDSLFMALLTGGFLAMATWWRAGAPAHWLSGLGIGAWFGVGLLNRALVWPFLPILGIALYAVACRMGVSPMRALRVPAAVLAVVALCASPVVVRNWDNYGVLSLSSQSGGHLALWVYPLAKEAHDGTPYESTFGSVQKSFADRLSGTPSGSPFVQSDIYARIAREGIAELGFGGIFKAWALGVAVNLAAPATLMMPTVMALPRTGFYATQGDTPLAKVANFLTQSSSFAYLGWMLAGAAIEWPIRALAFLGVVLSLWRRATFPPAALAALWIGFVLAINGPIASPKYRLPIEPIAMAMAGLAMRDARSKNWRDRNR